LSISALQIFEDLLRFGIPELVYAVSPLFTDLMAGYTVVRVVKVFATPPLASVLLVVSHDVRLLDELATNLAYVTLPFPRFEFALFPMRRYHPFLAGIRGRESLM
jgi:hypothetical protein